MNSLVPVLIGESGNKTEVRAACFLAGLSFMVLLARLSVPLPWTPVPLTGQTFAVALIALTWGARRATAIFAAYLLMGATGIPVFASGGSILTAGPTAGYLAGMLGASFLVGRLADLGWTGSFMKSAAAAFLGSLVIFSSGLAVLSLFIPAPQLLTAGLLPFMPGEIVKNLLAAALAWQARKRLAVPER